jgi:hypothetical protein
MQRTTSHQCCPQVPAQRNTAQPERPAPVERDPQREMPYSHTRSPFSNVFVTEAGNRRNISNA